MFYKMKVLSGIVLTLLVQSIMWAEFESQMLI